MELVICSLQGELGWAFVGKPNVSCFRSFTFGGLGALEKISTFLLGRVGLVSSLGEEDWRRVSAFRVWHASGYLVPLFSVEYSRPRCFPEWGRGSPSVEWNGKLNVTSFSNSFLSSLCTFIFPFSPVPEKPGAHCQLSSLLICDHFPPWLLSWLPLIYLLYSFSN